MNFNIERKLLVRICVGAAATLIWMSTVFSYALLADRVPEAYEMSQVMAQWFSVTLFVGVPAGYIVWVVQDVTSQRILEYRLKEQAAQDRRATSTQARHRKIR